MLTVDTSLPWHIASTTGQSRFVVRPEQLERVVDGDESAPHPVTEQSAPLPSEQRVHFDGASIASWSAFHDQSAALFGFPNFYGRNLNAWIDCLTYVREGDGLSRFELGPEASLVIEVDNSRIFRECAPEIFAALIECVAFVNHRQKEAGERPAIQLLLME